LKFQNTQLTWQKKATLKPNSAAFTTPHHQK
jgi:hypothetical protein